MDLKETKLAKYKVENGVDRKKKRRKVTGEGGRKETLIGPKLSSF